MAQSMFTSEIGALKASILLWNKIGVHSNKYGKREASIELFGGPWAVVNHCPCCDFNFDGDDEYGHYTGKEREDGFICSKCPALGFWVQGSDDFQCEDKKSPYQKWKNGRQGYSFKVRKVLKEALEYWQALKEMNCC